MNVNLSAMDKLPLITVLVLERANNHCYEKYLWVITKRILYLLHKDNRNTWSVYCLYYLTIIFLFYCWIYHLFSQNSLCIELLLGSDFSLQLLSLLLFFVFLPVGWEVNLTVSTVNKQNDLEKKLWKYYLVSGS